MELDKQQIVDMLRERGEHDKADKAEKQLPQKVDHEQHSDMLDSLGLNPQELLSKL